MHGLPSQKKDYRHRIKNAIVRLLHRFKKNVADAKGVPGFREDMNQLIVLLLRLRRQRDELTARSLQLRETGIEKMSNHT